jgi:hypothetical protein
MASASQLVPSIHNQATQNPSGDERGRLIIIRCTQMMTASAGLMRELSGFPPSRVKGEANEER